MNAITLLLWLAVGSDIALSGALIRALKADAPELFFKLGSPDLYFIGNTPGTTYGFWRWVMTGTLVGLSWRVRVMTWLLRILTPLAILIFLVAAAGALR